MRKRNRSQRRGVTLIETMIALVVLVTGVAAVFGMATHVHTANRNLAFQTISLDAFARVSAEIRNAQCDFQADQPNVTRLDGGLTVGNHAGPAGSISYVGRTDGMALERTQPIIQIQYDVVGNGLGVGQAQSLDIDVEIREITNDPIKDAAVDGFWIKRYPLRKVCNARLDPTRRGEYL